MLETPDAALLLFHCHEFYMTQKMKGVGCSNLGNAKNKFLHDVVLGRDMFLFALALWTTLST